MPRSCSWCVLENSIPFISLFIRVELERNQHCTGLETAVVFSVYIPLCGRQDSCTNRAPESCEISLLSPKRHQTKLWCHRSSTVDQNNENNRSFVIHNDSMDLWSPWITHYPDQSASFQVIFFIWWGKCKKLESITWLMILLGLIKNE